MGYENYALIKKSTLTDTANAIRAKKGTSEPIDPANFASEISDISSGGSVPVLDGGFTVNFHDEEGTLIESHSAELGRDVYAPASFNEMNYWSDADGTPYTLPLTINTADTVLNLYATEAKTCAQVLYNTFEISQEEYPQVAVRTESNQTKVHIHFGTNVTVYGGQYCYFTISYNVKDMDMVAMVQCISNNKDSATRYDGGMMDLYASPVRYFANFVVDAPGFEGRLDEVMFDTFDRLHPYALQEKTVTENGEVTPDEGYYGLSRVIVDVPTGSILDDGYTVKFHWTDGNLVEVHSALLGKPVGAPLSYFPVSWRDSDDAIKQFPITMSESGETDIFASNYSYNLANCNSCPTGTSYGVTIEAHFDEGGYMRYISTTGVNNDEYMDVWYDIGTAPDLEAGVEYVLTGCPSGGGSVINNATESWGLQLYSDNGADKSDFGDGVVFTPSKVYTNIKIRICVGTKTTKVNGLKWYPMLRRSDTGENVYLPYAGTN